MGDSQELVKALATELLDIDGDNQEEKGCLAGICFLVLVWSQLWPFTWAWFLASLQKWDSHPFHSTVLATVV